MTPPSRNDTGQFCVDVPHAHALRGLEVHYNGRGTQAADLIAGGIPVAGIVAVAWAIAWYSRTVRKLTNGAQGPFS